MPSSHTNVKCSDPGHAENSLLADYLISVPNAASISPQESKEECPHEVPRLGRINMLAEMANHRVSQQGLLERGDSWRVACGRERAVL